MKGKDLLEEWDGFAEGHELEKQDGKEEIVVRGVVPLFLYF